MFAVGIGCLFGLVVAEFVIHPVLYGVGEILLGDVMVGKIVGIEIMLSLDIRIGAVAVFVLQMAGRCAAFLCADIFKGGIYGGFGGVGLGGGGKEYYSLRKGYPCFGETKLQSAVNAGFGHCCSDRVGKSDILRGNYQQAAAERDYVSRFDEPCGIVEGSVFIAATNGLLQGGQDIVMLVAVTVIAVVASLGEGFGFIKGYDRFGAVIFCAEKAQLTDAHRFADISAAATGDMLTDALFRLYLHSRFVGEDTECPFHCGDNVLGGDGLELEHRTSAENGVIDVKIGVLGGGGDKGYLAVFNIFKEGLLLLFVEILYLVEVQKDAVHSVNCACVGDNIPDVGCSCGGAIELMELHSRIFCNYPCNGGFSYSRGTVKYHIGDIAAVDYAPEISAFVKEMTLTDNFIKVFGAYSVCKGGGHFLSLPL